MRAFGAAGGDIPESHDVIRSDVFRSAAGMSGERRGRIPHGPPLMRVWASLGSSCEHPRSQRSGDFRDRHDSSRRQQEKAKAKFWAVRTPSRSTRSRRRKLGQRRNGIEEASRRPPKRLARARQRGASRGGRRRLQGGAGWKGEGFNGGVSRGVSGRGGKGLEEGSRGLQGFKKGFGVPEASFGHLVGTKDPRSTPSFTFRANKCPAKPRTPFDPSSSSSHFHLPLLILLILKPSLAPPSSSSPPSSSPSKGRHGFFPWNVLFERDSKWTSASCWTNLLANVHRILQVQCHDKFQFF